MPLNDEGTDEEEDDDDEEDDSVGLDMVLRLCPGLILARCFSVNHRRSPECLLCRL